MTHEAHRYTVILRHTAAHESEAPPVTLFSADSHDAIIAHPQLGELLAEAAFNGWQQRQMLEVAVQVRQSR